VTGNGADLLARCREHLATRPDAKRTEAIAFAVPGRIEVLGKHTDYCGGRSLLAATEQGFVFVAAPRDDAKVIIDDVGIDETIEFELSPDLAPRSGHWSNYPMTAARRLARNFAGIDRGATIVVASDLPPAAGMSSSSAFLVGTCLVLTEINGLRHRAECRNAIGADAESLAAYLACVENGADFGALRGDAGVGTHGGSEDHTAILCSQPGQLAVYSFAPTRLERRVDLPPGLVFAIASSGIAAEKTGAALERYNRAARLAAAVARIANAHCGTDGLRLADILTRHATARDELPRRLANASDAEFAPEELVDRFEQFAVESEDIVPRAAECLATGDLSAFGDLVDLSQENGARRLGNQIDETVWLARQARELGAIAASAFGAGFGGSVWSLVDRESSERYLDAWRDAYRTEFPAPAGDARFFLTGAAGAARRV